MAMSNEILPCPFCGGKAIAEDRSDLHSAWLIGCDRCDCVMDVYYRTKEEAVEAWNRRAKDKQRIQELEADLALLREQQWEPFNIIDDDIETEHGKILVTVNGNEISMRFDDSPKPFLVWNLKSHIRLCRKVDAQPQPASVPDGEVLDWLKHLVLARENEMLCYIQRYNYEENSTQLATCRAALAWLDAQPHHNQRA